MRRSPAVPRFARRLVGAVAACAALASCTSKERAADTASAASDSATQTNAPAALARAQTAAALPGALTKPLDQYSGDELYTFVQRLKWGGGAERVRKCKGDAACDGARPTKDTRVRVDAVDGQDSISVTNLPKDGVVTVRASNKGVLEEDRYGFKPNKKFEYFLVVLPGTAGNGEWQLVELDTTAGARRHTTVGTGVFRPCNHPFQPNRVNRANFFNCADSHMSDSVQRSNLVMFQNSSDPMWTDCSDGCCIADRKPQ